MTIHASSLVITDQAVDFLTSIKEEAESGKNQNQYSPYVFRRKHCEQILSSLSMTIRDIHYILKDERYGVSQPERGWYNFENLIKNFDKTITQKRVQEIVKEDEKIRDLLDNKKKQEATKKAPTFTTDKSLYVPEIDPTYVGWANTKDVFEILTSGMWYPFYIVGESGNGKSFMVEQCCARAQREMFRVQIHEETDEDDLIGGYRLKNGETVFVDGPVVQAMKRGAVLFLDELDRGSNKLMCLQGILEGKPFLIKKTGEIVKPEFGFNIVAAANTKGKGSFDGRYIAATVLDEAFLERFVITLEQDYPPPDIERRILRNTMIKHECLDEEFAEHLLVWADNIRQTFRGGADIQDTMTTRRLCHIIATFAIFKDRIKSVNLAISRFDDDTKTAFLKTYRAIDPTKLNKNTTENNDKVDAFIDEAATTPF